MNDVRYRIEKGMGMASAAVLLALLVLPLVNHVLGSLFGIRWLTSASGDLVVWFFLVLNAGALLGSLFLLWPFLASGVSGRSPVGLGYLCLVVVQVGFVVSVAITTYGLNGTDVQGAQYVYGMILWVMVAVFIGAHYFLYTVIIGYLDSRVERVVALLGYLALALVFAFYWVPGPLLRRIGESLRFESSPILAGLDLFGVLFGMMQYFFVTLLPFYVMYCLSKKRLSISPWMNAVYIYTGIMGGAGYFAVVYTLMGSV